MDLKHFVIKHLKKSKRSSILVSMLIHVIRWLFSSNFRKGSSALSPNVKYHYIVSTFLAKYVYFLAWPAFYILKRYKILISINNLPAVGHFYPEIDYLNRLVRYDTRFDNHKVIYVYPKNRQTHGLGSLISNSRVSVIESGIVNLLIYPLALRYPEIAIDAAQSATCHNYHSMGQTQTRLNHQDTFRTRIVPYFKVREQTPTSYPLQTPNALTPSLIELIGRGPYVVIQVKDTTANATIKPVDPSSYLQAIKHWRDKGLNVIFAGREKMPNIFHTHQVVDYANSNLANSLNDYLLVLNANFVLSSASGFSYIADVLNIPLLSINNWGISGYPGMKTFELPTCISIANQPISFQEQLLQFYKVGQIRDDEDVPSDFHIIDNSADIILESVIELESKVDKDSFQPTTIEANFRSQFPHDLPGNGLSVVPEAFLTQHTNRISG